MTRTFDPKIDFGGLDFFYLPQEDFDWEERFVAAPTVVEIPRGYNRHLHSRWTGWEITVSGQIVPTDNSVETAETTKAAMVAALQGRTATRRFSLYRFDEVYFAECYLASGPTFTPHPRAAIPIINYTFTARSLRPSQVAEGTIPVPVTNTTAFPFEFPFLVTAAVTGITHTNRTGRDLSIKALAVNGCIDAANVSGGTTRFRVTAGGDSLVLDLSGADVSDDATSEDGILWEADTDATIAIETATAQHNGPFGHILVEG